MIEKIYSTQEINTLINFDDPTGRGSGKQRLIPRCQKAGLIIEPINIKGNRNGYKIIENNIDLPNEEWRQCYCKKEWEVSNLGRIRKIKGKQPLGSVNSDGYVTVCGQSENGKTTQFWGHRLIFFSFNPELINVPNLTIDHINGKRNDNRLENLQALSNIDNLKNRIDNQTKIKTLTTDLIVKYGYEKVELFLQKGLTNLESML